MWVSWSDALSGWLSSGNRRRVPRLQLLTANHKLIKILLTNCAPKSLSKKTWSGGEALLVSLHASVAHGARGVTCVVIRYRRTHGSCVFGKPQREGWEAVMRACWGDCAQRDVIVQTSSTALILWLFPVYKPGHGFFSFWLTPTPILLVSSPTPPFLKKPCRSLLWQSLPHPLPPQCPSPQKYCPYTPPRLTVLLNCLSL